MISRIFERQSVLEQFPMILGAKYGGRISRILLFPLPSCILGAVHSDLSEGETAGKLATNFDGLVKICYPLSKKSVACYKTSVGFPRVFHADNYSWREHGDEQTVG
jgi:hypothetical protein